jgi:type I restriction enzyme S subunit
VKKSTFRVAHSPDKTVSSEDFLICRGNGNVALVGRGKYPEMSLPEVAFPDTMIAARCDHGSISRGFLDHIWDRSIIRRQLEGAARTTNGTHKVNQTMIESVQIPLPSVGTQENFDRARASIGAQRARVLRLS